MKLQRDHLVHALAALGLVAAAVWFVQCTEWVDVVVKQPPRGDAATDRHHVLKQIVRRLGVRVTAPTNLDRLPPPGATLLLDTLDWNLFPRREVALRQWVEGGGHLVLPQSWMSSRRGLAWVPVATVPPPQPTPGTLPAREPECMVAREPDGVAPAFGARRDFRLCNHSRSFLRSTVPVQWSLDTPGRPQMLRVALGRGHVTVLQVHLTDRHDILRDDHALAVVAALRLAPGGELWLVDAEKRQPLLALIWQSGAPAVLLGALALALALWRGGMRFGPPAPAAPLARRSVAEQVRGTAHFIFRRDAAALHRAQLRALEQVARRHVPLHDRLARHERADAIARAAGLETDPLARAMDPSLQRSRRELIATLSLLETAARRLAAAR